MAQELDQFQRRRGIVAHDQFGRLWQAILDIISNGTCSPVAPKGWTDRLETPQKYIALVNDGSGTQRFEVKLGEWAADLEEAHEAYDKKLYGDAMMLFGAEGPKAYEDRTPALLNYTGPGPQALEPIWAALDGNAWVLGKTDVPDPRLTRFFITQKKTRPSFRDVPDDATADQLQTLEDDVDPDALGGKKIAVKKGQRRLVEAEV